MNRLLILILVLLLLMACAVASVLLARGWFTLRTTNSVAPPAPTAAVLPGIATPTLAALPPVGGATPGAPTDPGAVATPAPVTPGGGFNGVFSGTLSGDNGSSAPATLSLTQTGQEVSGRLSVGEGLLIDAGTCGAQAVPAVDQNAAGTVDPANPNHLQTTGNIPVAGFTIGVTLTADLAADGQTLSARADLALPFLCGRNPAISGSFARQ